MEAIWGVRAMGEEKRGSERFNLSVPVLYANLTKPGTVSYSYQHSSTLDVSASGLGIVLDEKVDKSDLIQIVMMLPVAPFVVTGLAQAVWAFQSTGSNQFRAGLRFIQVPPELEQALCDQVKQSE